MFILRVQLDDGRDVFRPNRSSMPNTFGPLRVWPALNLVATPTVILVDNSGKILDFWIGKPSKEVEQQILKAINANQHIAS